MNPDIITGERGVNRAPSIPKNAVGLAVFALFVCALVVAFAWFCLLAIRGALVFSGQPLPDEPPLARVLLSGPLVAPRDLILFLVGLLPLWLFIPAFRGFKDAVSSQRFLLVNDFVGTRVSNASARSWSWYALGYGFAAFILFLLALFVVLNDSAVGRTFFRLDLIFESFGLVLAAFFTNIKIFVIAEFFILIWALVVAIARMIPGRAGQPIRFLATAYTDIFRGLPSIITIYLVGFGLPLTGLPLVKDLPSDWAAILALTLTYGAYVAEVYRSGIESIHPSQVSAARSLGLSFGQTMRFVIVPQAVRRIIPPLLNDFIGLQKDTALVNVIGTIDAFNQAKILASNRFNLSTVTTVAILFVFITIPQARLVDWLLEREQRRTQRGS